MIWKTHHIIDAEKVITPHVGKSTGDQSHDKTAVPSGVFRLAIIGGGPKGLYALDHFLQQVSEKKPDTPIEILWFNDGPDFGSGPNYNVNQPDYLLINYCIGNIDAWDRNQETVINRLNLADWIKKNNNTQLRVEPTDFASRAVVGFYLQSATRQILDAIPDHIHVRLIPHVVNNVAQLEGDAFRINTAEHTWEVHNILLTTGHCYTNTLPINGRLDDMSDKYIESVYPVNRLDRIPSGASVGVVGMGLTFIDAVLHLTEGRGGVFDTTGNYIPSGDEPLLYPFSRNLLPILPRGPIYGADNKYRLQYLDQAWLDDMIKIGKKRKIDFFKEIYPVLDREIAFAYYSTLLQTREEGVVYQYVVGLPEGEQFNMQKLLFPVQENRGDPQEGFIQYLENSIREAEYGELKSPLMASTAVWREASPMIAQLYKNGGFTGDSQMKLDNLFGAFCRTSFGPPIANMKKVYALVKQGFIQMPFEDQVAIYTDEVNGLYLLKSSNVQKKVSYLIDARIGRPDLSKGNSLLYARLKENRLIVPFDNEGYYPGCPRMNNHGQTIVAGKNYPLYFYGSNTEGVLMDNDSLSRTKNNLALDWAVGTIKQIKEYLRYETQI